MRLLYSKYWATALFECDYICFSISGEGKILSTKAIMFIIPHIFS